MFGMSATLMRSRSGRLATSASTHSSHAFPSSPPGSDPAGCVLSGARAQHRFPQPWEDKNRGPKTT